MSFSKIKLWDSLVEDLNNLENDKELLITIGKSHFIVRAANLRDFENHKQTTMYADTSKCSFIKSKL